MKIIRVSSKGQVVIPAEYRERLGIEPGDEVNVRIRGQYLLIELDTRIEEDIDYFLELRGKLGEEKFDMNDVTDMIKDLLEQQFYGGDDYIVDRVGNQKVKIRGSGRILEESIKILAQASRHWLDGNYVETIREFAETLDLDFAILLSTLRVKIDSMAPDGDMSMIEMMGGQVVYSLAIASAITHFRERVGDIVTEKLIKRADELGYIKILGEDTVDTLITQMLAEKYSILMNLRTLRELARTSVKSTGQRAYVKGSEQLINELDNKSTPKKVIERKKRTLRRRIARAKEEGRNIDREEIKEELGLDLIEEEKKIEEEEDYREKQPELPRFDFEPEEEFKPDNQQ